LETSAPTFGVPSCAVHVAAPADPPVRQCVQCVVVELGFTPACAEVDVDAEAEAEVEAELDRDFCKRPRAPWDARLDDCVCCCAAGTWRSPRASATC